VSGHGLVVVNSSPVWGGNEFWSVRVARGLADRVLVNAPEIRDSLSTRAWIPPAKIDVVINGVDLDRWRPRWEPDQQVAGLEFRRAQGIADAAPLLVTIGNLTLQKDHANLVAACGQLRDRVPGLRVLVLGEGDLRATLQRDIDGRGLGETVTLAGFVPEPRAALAAADLFVLSSDNEGMAWVLMEAAASGLPIVTTDVSGARHCVDDGQTGRVVPVRDPGALAGAIGELLADAPRRHAQGRAARQLAADRLDAQRMLDETEAVLFGTEAPP
jgi:glycosyltransferase involved in cell wall biosynthesis